MVIETIHKALDMLSESVVWTTIGALTGALMSAQLAAQQGKPFSFLRFIAELACGLTFGTVIHFIAPHFGVTEEYTRAALGMLAAMTGERAYPQLYAIFTGILRKTFRR